MLVNATEQEGLRSLGRDITQEEVSRTAEFRGHAYGNLFHFAWDPDSFSMGGKPLRVWSKVSPKIEHIIQTGCKHFNLLKDHNIQKVTQLAEQEEEEAEDVCNGERHLR